MPFINNETRFIRIAVVILLSFTLIVMGCTNPILRSSNVDSTVTNTDNRLINGKTFSQFVFSEYQNRFDFNIAIMNYLKFIDNSTKLRGFDFESAIVYVLNNIHLFTDENLFQEIVEEGILSYGLTNTEQIDFETVIQNYIDYQGLYGGINLLGADLGRTLMNMKENLISTRGFTSIEQTHLTSLFNLISDENVSFEEIVSFLNQSSNNELFSKEYVSLISSATNSFTYYSSNEVIVNQDIGRIIASTDMASNSSGGITINCITPIEWMIIGILVVVIVGTAASK